MDHYVAHLAARELRAQLARAEKVIEVARKYGARYSWFIQQALAEYDRPSAPLDGRENG